MFDTVKDDKIYVFGSVDDMLAFQSGKAQAMEVQMPQLNPGKRMVIIEAADQATADQIAAGYAKLHPVAK